MIIYKSLKTVCQEIKSRGRGNSSADKPTTIKLKLNEQILTSTLTKNAKLVMLMIVSRYNVENGCFARVDTLINDLHLRRASFYKAIALLKRVGLLQVEKRNRTSNLYHVNWLWQFESQKGTVKGFRNETQTVPE